MAQSVSRALAAIKRCGARPEQINYAILSAINITLCLSSSGDERVAEGFNRDVAESGRQFRLLGFGAVFHRFVALAA